MTNISAERTSNDVRSYGIQPADREHLRHVWRDKMPIDLRHWTVAIGDYWGNEQAHDIAWDHTFHEYEKDQPYGVSTCTVLGRLVIQAWANYAGFRVSKEWCSSFGLVQVWPQCEEVAFPPKLKVTDSMLDQIFVKMHREFESETLGYVTR